MPELFFLRVIKNIFDRKQNKGKRVLRCTQPATDFQLAMLLRHGRQSADRWSQADRLPSPASMRGDSRGANPFRHWPYPASAAYGKQAGRTRASLLALFMLARVRHAGNAAKPDAAEQAKRAESSSYGLARCLRFLLQAA